MIPYFVTFQSFSQYAYNYCLHFRIELAIITVFTLTFLTSYTSAFPPHFQVTLMILSDLHKTKGFYARNRFTKAFPNI